MLEVCSWVYRSRLRIARSDAMEKRAFDGCAEMSGRGKGLAKPAKNRYPLWLLA